MNKKKDGFCIKPGFVEKTGFQNNVDQKGRVL